MLRTAAFLTLLAAMPMPAQAGSVALPSFRIEKAIKGVAVAIPVATSATREGGGPVRFTAIFDLSDLFAKTDAIVRASGVERDEHCGSRFAYGGTHFTIDGRLLVAAADFKAGQQICRKIIGIRSSATMKARGRISVPFGLAVHGNRIEVTHGKPSLVVADAFVRVLLETTRLDEAIQAVMSDALDQVLADPRATLQLPPAAVALGVTVETAQFEQDGQVPGVAVRGTLPAAAGLVLGL